MKISSVGSLNVDFITKIESLPKIGETVSSHEFYMLPGGKGLNQAVSSSRLGENTELIGAIGSDYLGSFLLEFLEKEYLKIKLKRSNKTGMAFVTIDEQAMNFIIIFSGANFDLDINFIKSSLSGDIILTQQEIKEDVLLQSVHYARSLGKTIVHDPSPLAYINNDVLKNCDFITPNEVEASELSKVRIKSVEDAKIASRVLYKKYGSNIIIKLGSKGSLLNDGGATFYEPFNVTPVDTTGAGDCFNGAFAATLARTSNLDKSIEFANKAAAISTLKLGGAPSFPTMKEILEYTDI